MRKVPMGPMLGCTTVAALVLAGASCSTNVSRSERPLFEGDLKVLVGKRIFFDETISANDNQSCATCHGPEVGWTGPDEDLNRGGAVYRGSYPERFGNRKPNTSAYSTFAPVFAWDADESVLSGGVFWDGRATGWVLGNPAADQAQGPPLNPVEQALKTPKDVVDRVCAASYAPMLKQVWGDEACADVEKTWRFIALSIAAFEGSVESSPFSSKFDAWRRGSASLTAAERRGFTLFEGKAGCVRCHSLETGGEPAQFTDFTYENLGVPRNPENPFYAQDKVLVDGQPVNPDGAAFVDTGVGGFLESLAKSDEWRALPGTTEPLKSMGKAELEKLAAEHRGKHRVPTLRNVDKRPSPGFVKPYMHNGYFKSLEAVVHFYNTRDVLPRCPTPLHEVEALAQGCWPAPEVAENLNTTEVGALGLTGEEEADLVAFLRTLSDGWQP